MVGYDLSHPGVEEREEGGHGRDVGQSLLLFLVPVCMEEHVYSILAIEGIIEREEKQQPEPPPSTYK